ncbi:MAG: trypsin-like peptidase domain-containing protein [Anaerolineae bacterium]|jgi:2-alkenal reductase|nr:trypsin-like peptidase domain-containing protein [Anaerolineae bacterium]
MVALAVVLTIALASVMSVALDVAGIDWASAQDGGQTRSELDILPAAASYVPAESELQLARAYDEVIGSVVNISVATRLGGGTGSGFVIDNEGHIVTNNHVVENAMTIQVAFVDGTLVDAELIGTDPQADLAVIKVDPSQVALQPVTFANSREVFVGQSVMAIGSPFGSEQAFTLTTGIVSGLDRSLQNEARYSMPELIQTDAAINPGNSGGPLFDMAGNVVGVNTAILSQSGTGSGVGFAIPSNTVRRIVPYLIEFGSYEHSWLGISGMTVQPAQREAMNLDSAFKGVMVTLVSPNSPAERGGLRGTDRAINTPLGQIPVNGDIITAIDGQPIEDMNDLIMYLEDGTLPGDTVSLSVWRDGQQREVQVQLGARPS